MKGRASLLGSLGPLQHSYSGDSEDGAVLLLPPTRHHAAAKPVSPTTYLQSSQYNKPYLFKPELVGYVTFSQKKSCWNEVCEWDV